MQLVVPVLITIGLGVNRAAAVVLLLAVLLLLTLLARNFSFLLQATATTAVVR
jgi:hypothetical protein